MSRLLRTNFDGFVEFVLTEFDITELHIMRSDSIYLQIVQKLLTNVDIFVGLKSPVILEKNDPRLRITMNPKIKDDLVQFLARFQGLWKFEFN
jgi:hypothetical protein